MDVKLADIAFLRVDVSITTDYEGTSITTAYINDDYDAIFNGYMNSVSYDLDSDQNIKAGTFQIVYTNIETTNRPCEGQTSGVCYNMNVTFSDANASSIDMIN